MPVGTHVRVPNHVVGRDAPNGVPGWDGVITGVVSPTHVTVTFGDDESHIWPIVDVLEWVVTVTPAGSPRAPVCPGAPPGVPMLEPVDYVDDEGNDNDEDDGDDDGGDYVNFRVKRALHLEF